MVPQDAPRPEDGANAADSSNSGSDTESWIILDEESQATEMTGAEDGPREENCKHFDTIHLNPRLLVVCLILLL